MHRATGGGAETREKAGREAGEGTGAMRRELLWWLTSVLAFGLFVVVEDYILRGYVDASAVSVALYGGSVIYVLTCFVRLIVRAVRRSRKPVRS